MSKAKDRARAELGIIHRDGKLVNKEEWYKAHPTKQMLAERQVGVDSAVQAEMAAKFGDSYLCSKCNRKHKAGTKVYEQHKEFIHAEQ